MDSTLILDDSGAECLFNNGEMLFRDGDSSELTRIQSPHVKLDEIKRLVYFIGLQHPTATPYLLPSLYDTKKNRTALGEIDPMFEDSARVIVRHQQASVSLIQRRLKLGYSRAARIIDQLEEAGIVGPNDGSKARTVIVENEEQLETILRNL